MRGGTVQINWHDTKPVLTLDFHPQSGILATGGADFDIKLWLVNSGEVEKKIPTTSYQNSLSYHGSAVNILRFAPSGEQLASGADGGELLLWKLHSTETGQIWKVLRTLAFHRKDVLDLQWSTDGAFLISGSVDNSCIIWDVTKGSVHQILDAHFHYVQGVAWDPLSKYVASLSSDRSCRIYVNKPQSKTKGFDKLNYVCQHVITKAEQQMKGDSKSAKTHLFHDETLPSFFRRLAWSPDGSFLVAPAGSYKLPSAPEQINTAYVFSRKDLTRPALMLPSASKPVVAVRFCPMAFTLRGSNPAQQLFKLPYRLVFAVATLNSLYIYDTESVPPIAIMAGLHYAAITDIAWSPNGNYLALSSQDGYCTLVEFESGELGSPISLSDEKKVTGDENKSSVVEQPEEMVIDETSKKVEAERNGVNQVVPSSSTTPISDKPAKVLIEKKVNKEQPEDMVIDKTQAERNKVNQVPPSSSTIPMQPEGMVIDETQVERNKVYQVPPSSSTIPMQPEGMVIDETQAERNKVNQVPPSSSTISISNKPAKRRITPTAISPP